eukprot:UN27232
MQTCEYHDKNNGMNDMGFNNMMRNNMMRNNMQNNVMRNNYRGMEAEVGSEMNSSQDDRQTCSSNSDCGDESFCNFDFDTNGFCETCSSIDSCNDSGFITQRGERSCFQVCEKRK